MPSMRKRTSGSEKNNGGEMSRIGDSLDLTLYSQGDDIGATIYFVLPTGTTEATCPQNLTLAYHLCLESGINGKWITEEECTEWTPVERNVFVLHTFDGVPYQHLMTFYHTIKFEIVGPQCVRMSLECKDDVSIRNKGHPMFTLAMKDIVVTMSGFTEMKAEKEELEDLIRKMNGSVSGVFTMATTHIVTASLLTEKCYKAYENEKPVMRPEWVRAVWQDSESDLIQATDPKYVACACPIFFNLTICVSQVPSAKKNALKNIIEANGGSYSNELVKGSTKVLVIPAGQGGEKYRYACQWGLPCVTPNWIERCKITGHILDVSNYRVHVVADLRTSTPTKRKVNKFPDASMNMCSIIPNASRTEIEATYCSMKNDSVASNIDSDALNIVKKANDEGPFLDGCKIYLCGSDTMEQVRKLLNSSGATRLNGLNEAVTHVLVLGSKIPDNDANRIQRLNPKPYLVKIDWLIESAKQGSPADEDMFAFEQNNGKQMLPPCADPRSKNTIDLPLAQLTIHELVEKNSRTPPIAKSQGTPKQKDGQVSVIAKQTLDENNLTRDADSTHVSRSLKKQSVPLQECQPSNTTTSTIVEDYEDGSATEAPFQGMKFAINLTVLGEKNDIEEMICDMRGVIAEDNYDTIILPVVYTRDMNPDKKECFTKYWVLDCNEARTIDIPKVQYHKPLLSFKGIRNVLKSVVIAVSQYGNSEKSYLATLAIAMGAEYQDVFARKTTNTTLRSTHLICSVPENDKCFAAKRWGVPVVTADWIYECFVARKVLSVENYFPGSSKKNNSDSTISYIPVTPKAPNGTMNKVAERLTALTSHIGTSFYPPSTSKAIKNVLPANGFKTSEIFKRVAQTERTPSSSACNSDSDSQTTPIPTRRVSKPDYDTSLDLVPAKPVEESPIIPGLLSREGSRQLKRALDNICSNSPGPDLTGLTVQKKIETRDSVIMGSIWADLAAKYPKRNRNAPGLSQNQLPFVRVSLNNDAANSHPQDEPMTEENNLTTRRSRSPLVTIEDDVRPKKRRTNESSQSDDPEPDIRLNMEVIGADVDMDDDYNMRGSTRNNLMCNIVVFISKKCEDIKTLTDMIKNMGGQVTTELKSSELTHLVYQGKNAHMSKEVKSVTNSGVQVVDPLWVYKCHETNSLLNENIFLPGTAKLSNECTDSNESNVPSSKLSLDALNNLLQNQVVELPDIHDDSSDSTQRKAFKYQKLHDPKGKDVDSEAEDEHNEADNLEQAGCSPTKGNSKKQSEGSDNSPQENIPDKFVEPEKLAQLPKNSNEVKDDVILMDTVKTITSVTMTTRTRSTRSRSAALSNENNVAVANTKTRMTRQKVSNENITEASESRGDFVFSSKPIFMLSALPESVKPLALNTITKLGGLVSQEAVFDPSAEATIAGSLARSEKVLGSVAAGKPILPIAYIHACSKENRFLPPNGFLWSAKDAKNELENQVVAAANFWLQRITSNPLDKPYAQYRIFLCAKKCDPLSRLILSGGGTVVNKLEDANMIVGDKDMTKKYESANIPIHTSTFLSSVLFNFLPSSS